MHLIQWSICWMLWWVEYYGVCIFNMFGQWNYCIFKCWILKWNEYYDIYIYIYNVIENEIIALLDVKYYDGMNIMVYVLICMEDEIIVVFWCWILQWNEYYVVCIC